MKKTHVDLVADGSGGGADSSEKDAGLGSDRGGGDALDDGGGLLVRGRL